jgi:hypothetical protein
MSSWEAQGDLKGTSRGPQGDERNGRADELHLVAAEQLAERLARRAETELRILSCILQVSIAQCNSSAYGELYGV